MSRLNRPAEALAHARHAAEEAPQAFEVLDTLGVVLLQNQQASEAADALHKAALAAPDNPEIQFHLVQALIRTGSKAEARDVLRTLLTTNRPFSDKPEAEKLLKQLGS